jgi:hypothetical protein
VIMAKEMSRITLLHPKIMNQMTFDESLQCDIGTIASKNTTL